MASPNFTKILLVLHLAYLVIALPVADSASKAPIESDEGKSPTQDLVVSDAKSASASEVSKDGHDKHEKTSENLTAFQQTGKVLKLATLLPAETLRLLRMIAVPLVNRSIAAPENLLEEVANASPSKNLKRVDSFKHRAESTLHDKLIEPVENLIGGGINKSHSLIPNPLNALQLVQHLPSLREFFIARQLAALEEQVQAGLLGLLPHKNEPIHKNDSLRKPDAQNGGGSSSIGAQKSDVPKRSSSETITQESSAPARIFARRHKNVILPLGDMDSDNGQFVEVQPADPIGIVQD